MMIFQTTPAKYIMLGDKIALPGRTPQKVVELSFFDDTIWGTQCKIKLEFGVQVFCGVDWRFKVVAFEIPASQIVAEP